ncbi:hypothetical protein EWH99_04520 [Sporolactobacillus sp. THM7-7]|nr:hypothetical protein EWH99_04520 [Sporolactobacillus sp. THM7-7]
MSAMKKPTLREQLIREILDMSDDQLRELNKKITEYKKSLIPDDDEPLTSEEKKIINESLKENVESYSFEDVFGRETD